MRLALSLGEFSVDELLGGVNKDARLFSELGNSSHGRGDTTRAALGFVASGRV